MLSIIEITQFKDRIFREELNRRQRMEIKRSTHSQLIKHFLQIPNECARSNIVYGSSRRRRDYFGHHFLVYLKYIKKSTFYEINVEWETRKELIDLIENNRKWKANKDYDDPWNL